MRASTGISHFECIDSSLKNVRHYDMTGGEFLRKLHRLARERNLAYRFDEKHGKGSHGTVYLGTRFTRIKNRKKEIGKGLLDSMCENLGITVQDLEGR